jgi:hypothetical protein
MAVAHELLDYVHAQVHRGKMHHITDASGAITNGASMGIYMLNGASADFHAFFSIETGGNARFRLYEDPTVSSSTLILTACVMNRTYKDSASLTASFGHTPAFTIASASVLLDEVIGGGTGGNRAGGNARKETEWPFAKNTGYIVAACNLSGGTTVMSVAIEGYSH